MFGRLKIGVQAQNDTAGFVSDGTQPVELEGGVEWRRARLYALGTIRKRWNYEFRWDFAGGQVKLIDAWLQLRFNLFGRGVALRGGWFRPTFGLANDEGSNDILFMEQGFTSTFVPPRESGVRLHSESQRHSWDFSLLSGADGFECTLCDVLGIAGRYSTGFDFGRKDRLLHVGVNASMRWTDDQAVDYKERPESHIAPFFVDTGPIPSERVDTGLLEGAFLQGPFSLQGEYVVAGVKQPDAPKPVFYAFYVSGSYALTGEMRQYRKDLGTIRRIRPKRELRDGSGGLGAFEIALRFSRIDLNDQDITGGTLNDLSFAFNWYPTYPTRVSFNVIRAKREAWEPVWIFQARLQLAY